MRDGAAVAREERARVLRDERVVPVAELAGDADQALLGENALDLGLADHPERVGDALLRAAALEARRPRLEQAHVVVGQVRLEELRRGASLEQGRRRER